MVFLKLAIKTPLCPTQQVDLVLSTEQAFPILRHHKRFAITSHAVYPNERLRWHKRLWRKFYSLVWDDDLTDSIQSSLNPDEVCSSSH